MHAKSESFDRGAFHSADTGGAWRGKGIAARNHQWLSHQLALEVILIHSVDFLMKPTLSAGLTGCFTLTMYRLRCALSATRIPGPIFYQDTATLAGTSEEFLYGR
jgi:hypothetical protein